VHSTGRPCQAAGVPAVVFDMVTVNLWLAKRLGRFWQQCCSNLLHSEALHCMVDFSGVSAGSGC
jgi:hypothetical protein